MANIVPADKYMVVYGKGSQTLKLTAPTSREHAEKFVLEVGRMFMLGSVDFDGVHLTIELVPHAGVWEIGESRWWDRYADSP